MSFLEGFQSTVQSLGQKTKNKIDTTRLEIKIKNYSKEIRDLFQKIGILVYETHKTDDLIDKNELEFYYTSIDRLRSKVKSLERQIFDIKSEAMEDEAEVKTEPESKEPKKYAKISIKEDDLRLARTADGIKLLRFCPQCDTGNAPEECICSNCGAILKE